MRFLLCILKQRIEEFLLNEKKNIAEVSMVTFR